MIRTYIWFPKVKQGVSEEDSVHNYGIGWGHAAIEIVDNIYISKWPTREDTPFGYIMSYEEDIDVCGREANEIIEICNLDEEMMAEYWEEVRQQEFDGLVNNCCHVAAKVLHQGFFWINDEDEVDTFAKRMERMVYRNFGDSLIQMISAGINENTTWSPYTVSGLAKYIKKIME